MKLLTAVQEMQLVRFIIEDFGDRIEFDAFSEAMLGMLEDVAGFETAPQSTINTLIQKLWRKYNV